MRNFLLKVLIFFMIFLVVVGRLLAKLELGKNRYLIIISAKIMISKTEG